MIEVHLDSRNNKLLLIMKIMPLMERGYAFQLRQQPDYQRSSRAARAADKANV
jgi:hypothetical protein